MPIEHPFTRASQRAKALREIAQEADRACERWAQFNSPHEGYAVILEELDELWELVKAKTFDRHAARREAIQVAAMAVRFAAELCPIKVEADDA